MTNFLAFGINHKTAPISIRERLNFSPEKTAHALAQLKSEPAIREAAILSTCNRTEIYIEADQPIDLENWLAAYQQLSLSSFKSSCYYHYDVEAVKHMMRVASGLDSMVLGEAQILGQMKDAFHQATAVGSIGARLQPLFQAIFAVSKQVRHQTQIGAHPVTLAYTLTKMAQQIFADMSKQKILFVGAGDTIELVALHLKNVGCHDFTFANRSADRAGALVQQFQGQSIPLSAIPDFLKHADIVVTATRSELPILGKGMVEQALKARKHRPMVMADLAVPRDIEPEVRQLEDVYLYDLDDLQQVMSQNYQNRAEAALEAECLIDIQAQHYVQQLKVVEVSNLIQRYRDQISDISDQELQRTFEQLQKGRDPQAALAEFAHRFSNKILHQPTQQIRSAAYEGDVEVLKWFEEWFLK